MTSLVPWFNSNAAQEMRNEMDQVMRRFFAPPVEIEDGNGNGPMMWAPRVDVIENANEFIVKADLPGVDPNDTDISIRDGVLTIKGERREEKEEKKENYQRQERFYGSFRREISLPSGVDESKISATTSKGVINITVPKKPGAQPRKIPLKAAN